jgi:uncharacterized RDD family membrane protein YckC
MTSDNDGIVPTAPFAGFERRSAAAIIDVGTVFFLTFLLMSNLKLLASWAPTGRPVLAAVALLYFAGGWASPLSATPAQWALRFRIVDESGNRLGPGRAIVRAVVFLSGVLGISVLAQVPENRWLLLVVAVSLAAFWLALFTKNRQGLHDLIVRSVAVKSAAIKSPEHRSEIRGYTERNTKSPWKSTQPRFARVILASVLPVVVLVGLYNAALVRYEMGLRLRISYAYSETSSLRSALEAAYRTTDQWEKSEAMLGTPTKLDFPDGGYFILEDEGVIRIRFTVIRELKRISLVVTPHWDGNTLNWNCRAEGEIAGGALPAHCRN